MYGKNQQLCLNNKRKCDSELMCEMFTFLLFSRSEFEGILLKLGSGSHTEPSCLAILDGRSHCLLFNPKYRVISEYNGIYFS